MWRDTAAPAPVPVSVTIALTPGLAPVAVSVAVLWPGAVGANWTVTAHDLSGPRLASVQVSAVLVNVDDPASVIVSAPDPEAPWFVTVNCWDCVCPGATSP